MVDLGTSGRRGVGRRAAHRSNRRGILAAPRRSRRRPQPPGDRSIVPAPPQSRPAPRSGRPSARSGTRADGSPRRSSSGSLRNGIEESVHRGDIVEVDAAGRIIRELGDPDRVVTLRSTVKPFGLLALIEAGGIDAFDLEPAEIAIMASSHSGEDLHVRTLQGAVPPGRASARRSSPAARRACRSTR